MEKAEMKLRLDNVVIQQGVFIDCYGDFLLSNKWVNASRMKQDWGNMNGSGTTTG